MGRPWTGGVGLFSPLYHTVEHRGQRDVARLIHAQGVDVDLPTSAGLGYPALVCTFLADDGTPLPAADVIWRRSRGPGSTEPDSPREILAGAMLAASVNGWPETVACLLDLGADTEVLDPKFETTPQGWARHCERADTVTVFEEWS